MCAVGGVGWGLLNRWMWSNIVLLQNKCSYALQLKISPHYYLSRNTSIKIRLGSVRLFTAAHTDRTETGNQEVESVWGRELKYENRAQEEQWNNFSLMGVTMCCGVTKEISEGV